MPRPLPSEYHDMPKSVDDKHLTSTFLMPAGPPTLSTNGAGSSAQSDNSSGPDVGIFKGIPDSAVQDWPAVLFE
ncbi:hypothetical protein NHQ30_004290 [Ciborinia camelliae]|nr:hypothetical protein NHQ30_004290 [Ciborinia camelliae]